MPGWHRSPDHASHHHPGPESAVSVSPDGGQGATPTHNIGEVIQAADAACYAAKNSGRGCVCVCAETEGAGDGQKDRMNWAARIAATLGNDYFELYAQLISPTDRTWGGLHCEVLLRMRGDNGDIIPPGAFMPSAERYHMASRIDKWVIRHVIQVLECDALRLRDVEQISINLSGQSLGNRDFHRFVEELLAGCSVDLSKICFEVTETSAISSLEDARGFIERLTACGVGFSLDDFGSGLSSFAYLKELPVKYLKIDGQFVRNGGLPDGSLHRRTGPRHWQAHHRRVCRNRKRAAGLAGYGRGLCAGLPDAQARTLGGAAAQP